MKRFNAWPLALALVACESTVPLSQVGSTSGNPATTATGASPTTCTECVGDADCSGGICAQFDDDIYCTSDCTAAACATGSSCLYLADSDGHFVRGCVPDGNGCEATDPGGGTGGGATSGTTGTTGATTGTTGSTSGGAPTGVGPSGGTLASLSFAIVGDTRPPVVDDTSGYPNAIITKIYQDVQAAQPAFAITTGDYVFATPTKSEAGPQLDLYLAARALYSGTVFYTMGNHECTGYTTSNCGQGNTDGITNNYTQYMNKLVSTIGQTSPYYRLRVDGADGSWSAKFLFVAANAWDNTQATWLDSAMQEQTTYTFVVRHEGASASNAGVSGSAAIMKNYPYTALLAGHTHTFEYVSSQREIITGNGGAPLTGSINYGYVIASQNADGTLTFTVYDYDTGAVIRTFAIHADGTPV